MKKLLILLVLLSVAITAQTYKKIAIDVANSNQIKELIRLGVVPDAPVFNKDKTALEVFVDENQINILNRNGFSYRVLISDWRKYYSELKPMSKAEQNQALARSYQKYGVKDFGYGSMGGFLTADEVYAKLDEMHNNFPDLITAKDTLGITVLGNPMYYVKISDNPNVDEDEPEVFYNSLIHAREPEAMMQMIYFMYYLLDNYGTDPEVTYLVNNREMYFLPIFNVDGYKYNQQTDPNGGGMWRKNRRTNSDGSMGVDLNRNWGYEWAYDNDGSSGTPSSETFRGTAPFSEPETEAVRQFCDAHNFKLVLNYHTYSDLLILPWGYIPEETPDSLLFREYAAEMTQYNGYTWGISSDIIYAVNGAADDWMYGEQSEKNKIYSMTTEVGTSSDGFWPPQSRILPLAEENVFPNLYLAWAAGGFVNIADVGFSSEYINPGEQMKIGFKVKNKGLGKAEGVSIDVSSLSDFVTVSGRVIYIDSLSARTDYIVPDSLIISVSGDCPIGEKQNLVAAISLQGTTVYYDTVSFIVGTPTILWADTSNSINDNWTVSSDYSQHWDLTTSSFFTPPTSFTDSPIGDYGNSSSNKMTLKNAIDLTGVSGAFLSFETKWDIENNWDAGRVRISTNGGSTWYDLAGQYTNPGAGQGVQPAGVPVYDGNHPQWVLEHIDLSQYHDQQIKLRFQLESDGWVTGDGWYIDDLKIMYYDSIQVSVDDEVLPNKFALGQNYPNPFSKGAGGNPTTTIKYTIPNTNVIASPSAEGRSNRSNSKQNQQIASSLATLSPRNDAVNVTLTVYDILGRKVATLVNELKPPGDYSVKFSGNGLPSGIYFYTLRAGNFSTTKKMILMK